MSAELTVKPHFLEVVDAPPSVYAVPLSDNYSCITAIYQPVDRRDAFFSLSFFLLASRRSIAPRVGFDFLRGAAGGLAAASSSSANWLKQSCRFFNWLLLVCRVIRMFVGWAARIRRTADGVASISAGSTLSVALDEVVFTCCPPAPPERANDHVMAAAGTVMPPGVRTSSEAFMVAILPDLGVLWWQGAKPVVSSSHPCF